MTPSSPSSEVDVLILAAGQGTRMPSAHPKVLQTLLGETVLSLVYAAVAQLPSMRSMVTVVGHEADLVRAEMRALAQKTGLDLAHGAPKSVEQTERLGTGHALMTALPHFSANDGKLLVINGDLPLIQTPLLAAFLEATHSSQVAFLSVSLADPAAYGRVVRDKDGRLKAIVEARDYDPDTHGFDPHEINSGVYALDLAAARSLVPQLTNDNRNREYYITDLIGLALNQGMDVAAIRAEDLTHGAPGLIPPALSLLGVNTPRELSASEEILRQKQADALLDAGVILHAPDLIRISPFAKVEPGAELFGPCHISGASHVEFGAVVEPHCLIERSHIGKKVRVRAFSHLEDAVLEEGSVAGPYVRLRPGAHLEAHSHAGNFVEMKKARLGQGSKANHLTYLGDAVVGKGVNIGAGTITCNYDGVNKHQTSIGDASFIGSNTALVAPVSLGERVLIGAGSVITKNVPDDTLAVARGRQTNVCRKKD